MAAVAAGVISSRPDTSSGSTNVGNCCFNQVFAKLIIVMNLGNLDAKFTWLGENNKVTCLHAFEVEFVCSTYVQSLMLNLY